MKLSMLFILLSLLIAPKTHANDNDSIAMTNDISDFLEHNGGIVNTRFYPTINREIQGSYNTTIFFDSTHKEIDTTMQVIVKDSVVETILRGTTTKRVEKLSFFCTGTHQTTGNFLHIIYTTNDAFIYFSKAKNDQVKYGDYIMTLMYKDKNEPKIMNFYIKKNR